MYMEGEKGCASRIMKKHAMCLTIKERATHRCSAISYSEGSDSSQHLSALTLLPGLFLTVLQSYPQYFITF